MNDNYYDRTITVIWSIEIDAAASLLARANEEKMMKTSKGQKEVWKIR